MIDMITRNGEGVLTILYLRGHHILCTVRGPLIETPTVTMNNLRLARLHEYCRIIIIIILNYHYLSVDFYSGP